MVELKSFHPFQGRPLFGPKTYKINPHTPSAEFPSLSGKTSIRTHGFRQLTQERFSHVSIPFREDLYSDKQIEQETKTFKIHRFHPFQGRPLFGPLRIHSFQPPVEDIGFHPFQGRPLFGPLRLHPFEPEDSEMVSIPFREDLYSDDS